MSQHRFTAASCESSRHSFFVGGGREASPKTHVAGDAVAGHAGSIATVSGNRLVWNPQLHARLLDTLQALEGAGGAFAGLIATGHAQKGLLPPPAPTHAHPADLDSACISSAALLLLLLLLRRVPAV